MKPHVTGYTINIIAQDHTPRQFLSSAYITNSANVIIYENNQQTASTPDPIKAVKARWLHWPVVWKSWRIWLKLPSVVCYKKVFANFFIKAIAKKIVKTST
jgi:hypothetical protein